MKFVIIGCGLIAGSHANAIHNCKGAELAAICGRRKEPVFKFAKEQGCEGYTDVGSMLDEIRPDAAVICTPTYLHAEHVEQCAKRRSPLQKLRQSAGEYQTQQKKAGLSL